MTENYSKNYHLKILKNCLELVVNESYTELNQLFNQHMRWFNKHQPHCIPRELHLFQANTSKVSKTCLTCDDRELLLERSSVLTRKEKVGKFEMIRQYCTYGFTFQAEKTIKDLISDFPSDPDIWFELYLFYSSQNQKNHLAREALMMSIKLHFKISLFEYQNHQNFLVNLSRFLYSVMLRKHTLESVAHKAEFEKARKIREKRERYSLKTGKGANLSQPDSDGEGLPLGRSGQSRTEALGNAVDPLDQAGKNGFGGQEFQVE